jgi:hypothetical protein
VKQIILARLSASVELCRHLAVQRSKPRPLERPAPFRCAGSALNSHSMLASCERDLRGTRRDEILRVIVGN